MDRDIYLYFPYRMLKIFPTVLTFGNLDLTTGKQLRNIKFFPSTAKSTSNGIVKLRNGISINTIEGKLTLGKQIKNIKYLISTNNTKNNEIRLQSKLFDVNGDYAVVFMKSYNMFVVMDIETFNSMYVQMFILGKYDKNIFELKVSSPYSKIYKLKK